MGSSSLLSPNSSFLSTPRNTNFCLSLSIYSYCKPKKDLVLLCTSRKGFQQSYLSTIRSEANRRGQSQNHAPIEINSRQVDGLIKGTKPDGGKINPGGGGGGGGASETSQDRMIALLKRIHDEISKGPPAGSKGGKPYFPKSKEPIQSFQGNPNQKYSPGNTPRYNSDRETSFKGAGDKEFSTKYLPASNDKLAKGPDSFHGMNAPRPGTNLPRRDTNFSRPVSKFVRRSPMKQYPNSRRLVKLTEEANRNDPVEEPENLAQLQKMIEMNLINDRESTIEETTESDSEDQTSEAIESAFEDHALEAIESAFEDLPSAVVADTASEAQELHEMKLDKLKELAKAKGLKGYSKKKKADLVELLKGCENLLED